MAANRTSQRIAKLATQLTNIRTGRPLPSEVKALRVRYQGLKGNAAVRSWVKTELPSIAFASPNLTISSDPAPEPSTSSQDWLRLPGVLIEFNDPALSPAFLPSAKGRSETFSKKFWDTIEDPVALEALRKSLNPVRQVSEKEKKPEGATVTPAGAVAATVGIVEDEQEPSQAVKDLLL
ncbi:hypothetical protein T439DRAFT_378849 [Meredithblackwellia eburnea MCA 4105]